RCHSGNPWPAARFDRRQSSCLLWFARVLGPSSAEATPCSVWSAGLGLNAPLKPNEHRSPRAGVSHIKTTGKCSSLSAAIYDDDMKVKQRRTPGYRIIPAPERTAPWFLRKHPGGASYSRTASPHPPVPSRLPPSTNLAQEITGHRLPGRKQLSIVD